MLQNVIILVDMSCTCFYHVMVVTISVGSRVGSTIHWINYFPVDNSTDFDIDYL